MKKLIFALMVLAMALPSQAVNVFKEGTVWTYWGHVDGSMVIDGERRCWYIYTFTLESIGERCGREALGLFVDDELKGTTHELDKILSVEGDRVYILQTDEASGTEQWGLLYDFSIQVGESRELVRLWSERLDGFYGVPEQTEAGLPFMATVIEERPLTFTGFPDEVTEEIVVRDPDQKVLDPIIADWIIITYDVIWVRGYGPLLSLFTNYMGEKRQDGTLMYLSSITNGDEIYYTGPIRHEVGIEDVEADGFDCRVTGRTVVVDGLAAGSTVTVAAADGRVVLTKRAEGPEASIDLPTAGYYIVSTPSGAKPVMIR